MDRSAAHAVLVGIKRKIRKIVRLMTDDSAHNKDSCLVKIDSCLSHLESVGNVLDPSDIHEIQQRLMQLRSQLLSMTTASTDCDRYYTAERVRTGNYLHAAVNILICVHHILLVIVVNYSV